MGVSLRASFFDSEVRGVITVNGKSCEFQEGLDIREFLRRQGYQDDRIAVERNGEVIKRSSLSEIRVEDGDVYEVVSFVGGG